MKGKKLIVAVVLALVGAAGLAHAEEKEKEAEAALPETTAAAQEEQPSWPAGYLPFEVTGSFDLGFRAVDVKGSENKYREDVNLKTGPRLFNLDLNINPGDDRFFDQLDQLFHLPQIDGRDASSAIAAARSRAYS